MSDRQVPWWNQSAEHTHPAADEPAATRPYDFHDREGSFGASASRSEDARITAALTTPTEPIETITRSGANTPTAVFAPTVGTAPSSASAPSAPPAPSAPTMPNRPGAPGAPGAHPAPQPWAQAPYPERDLRMPAAQFGGPGLSALELLEVGSSGPSALARLFAALIGLAAGLVFFALWANTVLPTGTIYEPIVDFVEDMVGGTLDEGPLLVGTLVLLAVIAMLAAGLSGLAPAFFGLMVAAGTGTLVFILMRQGGAEATIFAFLGCALVFILAGIATHLGRAAGYRRAKRILRQGMGAR